ncbi:MAG: hypothetical protein V2A76_09160 [Planctomycetota bacterium]
MSSRIRSVLSVSLILSGIMAGGLQAQCPEEPTLQNWTGGGTVVVPGFVAGEEAGVVLNAPAAHYPIEIVKIQIGWGSYLGGNPDSLEEAIKIYPAGLPNPGTAQFSLAGPVLVDGFINEFDISLVPGNKIINSGPFSISLELMNNSTFFGPAPVHDGNGCQSGKNMIKAIPGGWSDGCALGISGQWVMGVIYRRVNCTCTTTAAAITYGAGHPGTYGIPLLTATNTPVIGAPVSLFISNSLGASTTSMLYLGLASQSGTIRGAPFLVVPTLSLPLGLPPAGMLLPINVPPNPNLCNVSVYIQVLELDAGASQGVSATSGLEMLLGV